MCFYSVDLSLKIKTEATEKCACRSELKRRMKWSIKKRNHLVSWFFSNDDKIDWDIFNSKKWILTHLFFDVLLHFNECICHTENHLIGITVLTSTDTLPKQCIFAFVFVKTTFVDFVSYVFALGAFALWLRMRSMRINEKKNNKIPYFFSVSLLIFFSLHFAFISNR